MFNLLTKKNLVQFLVASCVASSVVFAAAGCSDAPEHPSKMIEGRSQMMKQREDMKKMNGQMPGGPGSPQAPK